MEPNTNIKKVRYVKKYNKLLISKYGNTANVFQNIILYISIVYPIGSIHTVKAELEYLTYKNIPYFFANLDDENEMYKSEIVDFITNY